jgi:hypothetical protein
MRWGHAGVTAERSSNPMIVVSSPTLPVNDLNRQQIVVTVRPSASLTEAAAIENVVIKRKSAVHRPSPVFCVPTLLHGQG